MERLTTPWMDGTFDTFDPIDIVDNEYSKINYERVLNKLGAYEDAEEQGLLLRLPYNIATCGVVYYVDEKDCEIYHLQADSIRVSKMMISNRFLYEVDNFEFFYEDFGKIVFTTKEEAEQKLAEMKGV